MADKVNRLYKVVEGLIALMDPGEWVGSCGDNFESARGSDDNPDGCDSGSCVLWDKCCELHHRHVKCEELRELLHGSED